MQLQILKVPRGRLKGTRTLQSGPLSSRPPCPKTWRLSTHFLKPQRFTKALINSSTVLLLTCISCFLFNINYIVGMKDKEGKPAVNRTHVPRGCLHSAGTEVAHRVRPLGASVSLPAWSKKRTSCGSGFDGVAFTSTGWHMKVDKGNIYNIEKAFSCIAHPYLSEDLSRCHPVRVSSEHQKVCTHKTRPPASETNEQLELPL